MVRWLCENTDYENDECYDKAIEHALTVSDDDLVKFMLSPGRCVLDHAITCPQVEVIELMLDCKYLRRDAKSAMRAVANLAGSGRLDLMQQIALLHSPLEEDCSNWERWSNFWIESWIKALDNAGAFGELECVQWLVQYPIGMIACELIKKWPSFDDPTYYAADKGHWKIVQYLCEQKISIHLDLPLDRAIRNDHIKCVEVLLQQFLNIKKQPEFCNFQPQDTPADQRHNESSVCDLVVTLSKFNIWCCR